MVEGVRYELVGDRKVAVIEADQISNLEISRTIATIKASKGNDDPFHVFNLTALVERVMLWHTKLPRIQPYYAVKCNDDPVLVRVLAELGLGFDCASKREIDQICGIGLTLPERILYANPCKTRSFVNHAAQLGVRLMTFDSAEELTKIKAEHNSPQLILRIAIGDPNAQCPLSVKFGCDPPMQEGPTLLRLAKKLDVPVVGISFHVGSGCNTPSIFRDALLIARNLFDMGESYGHKMRILDIGGGFPGEDTEKITFDQIVEVVGPSVDEFFPVDSGVDVIAEPGRFFASAAVSEAANVVARKRINASRITKNVADAKEDAFMYYINDGVYGSFNCILFDHAHPRGQPLFNALTKEEANLKYTTTIWGPTCDGLDQIEVETEMRELQTGDWLYYPNMGAYTTVASTNFNGFDKPKAYYVIDNATWQSMFGIPSHHVNDVSENCALKNDVGVNDAESVSA